MNCQDRNFTGVVFDLDGVLADTEPLHIEHWELTMKRHGTELPAEWFEGLMGYPDAATAQRLASDFGIELDWESLLEHKREAVSEASRTVNLAYAGIAEGLERLGEIPKAVATSSCGQVAEAILSGCGLLEHFSTIVSSDDVERTKPDPESYLTACRRIEQLPHECAAIEDSPAGIEAASRAGLYVIAVCTSYPREKLSAADIIFETPGEAITYLADLFRGVGSSQGGNQKT
ncbi:MAG: HAD family hydrolase [Spirochaetota bacterium]